MIPINHVRAPAYICRVQCSSFVERRSMRVLLLPWLAHGHVSPYLQLSKKLSSRNIQVLLCSTDATLRSIKESVPSSNSIQLLELRLPSSPDLPPHLHTTNRLPPRLMRTLLDAFPKASPEFTEILRIHDPDLVIYDLLQPWAAEAAASCGIPAVMFLTYGAAAISFFLHISYSSPKDGEFPFRNIFLRPHEEKSAMRVSAGTEDGNRCLTSIYGSNEFILMRTCKEFEGKYIDYLSIWTKKNIIAVGSLMDVAGVEERSQIDSDPVMEWLDSKTEKSTVFVSFGSEYFLEKEDMVEIAHGLELSGVNFIWVLRFPVEEETRAELPVEYLERVGERGMVVEWAPQKWILRHSSIAAIVSHCGWSSTLEAMEACVPIVAMPMQLDQPVNARLVEELGVGVEAMRDGNGMLHGEDIARVIREVVSGKHRDKITKNARKMSDLMRENGEFHVDVAVKELIKLCGKTKHSTRVSS